MTSHQYQWMTEDNKLISSKCWEKIIFNLNSYSTTPSKNEDKNNFEYIKPKIIYNSLVFIWRNLTQQQKRQWSQTEDVIFQKLTLITEIYKMLVH
jgi:hypothetical protein